MSDVGMLNSMTLLGGHALDMGAVVPVEFTPGAGAAGSASIRTRWRAVVPTEFRLGAGPRFDVWALPASLTVSQVST